MILVTSVNVEDECRVEQIRSRLKGSIHETLQKSFLPSLFGGSAFKAESELGCTNCLS